MSRRAEFDYSAVQVHHEPDMSGGHVFSARLGGNEVGRMELYHDGEIATVEVEPTHQRQGVATRLWHHAVHQANSGHIEVWPRHSSYRTNEGEAWAQSLGEDLPPLRKSTL